MQKTVPSPGPSQDFNWRQALVFIIASLIALTFGLSLYVLQVLRHVQPSPVPSTHKWFLLQEVPGPRLIIESGSNSHHGLDTDRIGEVMDMTAINIADNAGYDLEQKVARLEKHTRRGDIVILPLEWSYYTRDALTDDFVDQIPAYNRDYMNAVSLWDRLRLALSLPPAAVFGFGRGEAVPPSLDEKTDIQKLYVASLTHPSGHSTYEKARPPALGVSDKSCDAYLFWDGPVKLSKTFKRALKRLSALRARGVEIYFAWPVMTGDDCLSDTATVSVLVDRIEREVEKAGFEFLGRPADSLYPLKYRDDSPYHLVKAGTDLHTGRFINLLQERGIGTVSGARDLSSFARMRLYEMERKAIGEALLMPLPVDEDIRADDARILDFVDFAAGWWAFEPYGRWMRDNEAILRLYIPEELPKGAYLQLAGEMAGFGVERGNLMFDGQVIGTGLLGQDHVLSANLDTLPRGQTVLLTLRFSDAPDVLSPYDRGYNADKRTMSFHLQRLSLKAIPEPSQDQFMQLVFAAHGGVLPLDQPILLKDPISETMIHFGDGWWEREPAGRWMGCCEVTFSLDLPPDMPPETVLEISGDVFGGGVADIEATLNGEVRVQAQYSRDMPLKLPLRDLHGAETLEVALSFQDPIFESPKDLGVSDDPRVLSAFITVMELSTL